MESTSASPCIIVRFPLDALAFFFRVAASRVMASRSDIGTPVRCMARCSSMATSSGPHRLTAFTPNTLHAVATAVANAASDSVYTTSASSSRACSQILYASLPSLRKRNTYRFVGAERFITSANCVSAARQVFAADSPVQSERTKMGLGSTSMPRSTVVEL